MNFSLWVNALLDAGEHFTRLFLIISLLINLKHYLPFVLWLWPIETFHLPIEMKRRHCSALKWKYLIWNFPLDNALTHTDTERM